jgi:hypothetical protein
MKQLFIKIYYLNSKYWFLYIKNKTNFILKKIKYYKRIKRKLRRNIRYHLNHQYKVLYNKTVIKLLMKIKKYKKKKIYRTIKSFSKIYYNHIYFNTSNNTNKNKINKYKRMKTNNIFKINEIIKKKIKVYNLKNKNKNNSNKLYNLKNE